MLTIGKQFAEFTSPWVIFFDLFCLPNLTCMLRFSKLINMPSTCKQKILPVRKILHAEINLTRQAVEIYLA